jgi:hypothetical protein
MFPDFLTADLTFSEGTLREHLTAASAMVPEGLLTASGLRKDLRECIDLGYNHFWMNSLQDIGAWAEEAGRDAELPAEFWVHVAQAAYSMEFPEFMPYCLGKAQGWPRQDPGDLNAAFATLPKVDGMSRQLRKASRQAAKALRQDSLAAKTVLDQRDLEGLAEHLRSGAYDRLGEKLSKIFSAAFDESFALVTAKDFPAENRAHAWAIIGPNPFRVVVGGGLMPITHAEVWWRSA